jgi:2-dehydropantoate 2-reductase
MRFAIAGAGAMGSTFGGYLALGGHDVTLVDVDAEHMAAVREHGLVLRATDGTEHRVHLAATSDPVADLAPVDAVIVLCKSWANTAVAQSIRHAVRPDTWVATVQNGLGNDLPLAAVLGAERVLPGTTTVGAQKHAPGVVDVSPITSQRQSITQLGPPRAGSWEPSHTQPLVDALTAAGLPCELLPDADVVIWTKVAMATTAGPLTAVLGATVEQVASGGTVTEVLRAMFDEIVTVAAADGVTLDVDAVWEHAMTTYRAVGPHMTSMAVDVLSGRRSEIDGFCVEVARRGRLHGVPTPYMDVIGRLIISREELGGLR